MKKQIILTDDEYNQLLDYKKAYESNRHVLSSEFGMAGYAHREIKLLTNEEAIVLLTDNIFKLQEQITKLESRKWYKLF